MSLKQQYKVNLVADGKELTEIKSYLKEIVADHYFCLQNKFLKSHWL
jgi:hypothetical protein